MAYTKASSHTFAVHLWDAAGNDITTGTATAEISKAGGAYAAITNPAYVDDELWTVTPTDAQSDCDWYVVKVYHSDLQGGVLVYSDQAATAHGVNVTQVGGVAVELITEGAQMDLVDAPNATAVSAFTTDIDANSTQLAAIVADTGELQTNQGNWLTATGFATPTNITAGTIATVTNAVVTDAASRTASKADVSALATSTELAAVETHGDSTWATGAGLSASEMRTALGMAAADMDTQLDAQLTAIGEIETIGGSITVSFTNTSVDS